MDNEKGEKKEKRVGEFGECELDGVVEYLAVHVTFYTLISSY